jgi:hypothetical protein
MLRKLLASVAVAAMLVGCSSAQVSTGATDVGTVATAVQTACTTVNTTATAIGASPLALIPQVAGVIPYVTAACGTAEAVAAMVSKAVSDPTTVAWITNLNTELQADITAVKSL